MFQMRNTRQARGVRFDPVPASVGFETLERRRLLCGTVTSATTAKADSISAAETVKAAVLGPSAVEGHYKGSVTESSGTTLPVKIFVTSTSAELIIGTTRLTSAISSAHLVKIRKGVFDVTFTLDSDSVTVTSTVTKAGERISGTYTTSTSQAGTFAVVKYA